MPETTGSKQSNRRFVRGTSGNPAGRPPGTRHTALLALDAIGAEAGTDIMAAVVNAAKGGDMRAADILLRRLWPERKGRPVQMNLPAIMVPSDIVAALGAVADAVAAGELSPEEGAAVAGILEAKRRAVEAAEICMGGSGDAGGYHRSVVPQGAPDGVRVLAYRWAAATARLCRQRRRTLMVCSRSLVPRNRLLGKGLRPRCAPWEDGSSHRSPTRG